MDENFARVLVQVPNPSDGEVQVRNRWMAVDPAMRGRMSEAKSYIAPFALAAAMEGPAMGEVMQSRHPDFRPGDIVWSRLGWREVFNARPADLQKRDCSILPVQAYLGVAGMTGLTAYVGLLHIAELRPGDVVFVSAATGGVGSVVCQIAKLMGHKVIGAAGGARKTRYLLDELKVDYAIDYKAVPNLTKELARAAPEGIDIYFDNVGGEHLHAALAIANPGARFALCGMISQYNATTPPTAPRNLMQAVIKGIKLQGFIVLNYLHLEAQFLQDVTRWYESGQLPPAETIYDGIENALAAFHGLFTGDNLGRSIVRL
jgi:NADPH-dependent curcumin reductase CurA